MKNCNQRCCNRRENYYLRNNVIDNYSTCCKKTCSCNCGCMNSNTNTNNNNNPFPNNYLYGYAYTPNQKLNNTFTPQIGLENGSLFPELVSPYCPGQSIEFIEYLKNNDRNGGCGCNE